MPLISCIIPVWNCEALLERALRSICMQTFTDWDAWVVDDGSTDASLAVALRVAETDRRLHVVSSPHEGIVSALNRACSRSDSRFVARMDADDVSEPPRFERQLEALMARQIVGAIDCLVALEESGATAQGMRSYVAWLNSLDSWHRMRLSLFEESPLCHPAVMMQRQALLEAGGYLDDATPEDYSLWLRIVAAGYELAKLPRPLFQWSDLPHRLTRTDNRYAHAAMMRLKARMLPILFPAVLHGVTLCGTGPVARQLAAHLRNEGIPVRAYADVHVHRIGNHLDGVPVRGYHEWQTLPKPLLGALGRRSAKAQLRSFLTTTPLQEGLDYLFVA